MSNDRNDLLSAIEQLIPFGDKKDGFTKKRFLDSTNPKIPDLVYRIQPDGEISLRGNGEYRDKKVLLNKLGNYNIDVLLPTLNPTAKPVNNAITNLAIDTAPNPEPVSINPRKLSVVDKSYQVSNDLRLYNHDAIKPAIDERQSICLTLTNEDANLVGVLGLVGVSPPDTGWLAVKNMSTHVTLYDKSLRVFFVLKTRNNCILIILT